MPGINDAQRSKLILQHQTRGCAPLQASAIFTKSIPAPVGTVWSLLRKFDDPKSYKKFVDSCIMAGRSIKAGSVRVVEISSSPPATQSVEILRIFDEENYRIGIEVLDGDHRLKHYNSMTTLHPDVRSDGSPATLVFESYTVDVPAGKTKEEIQYFVKLVIEDDLQMLSEAACELLAQPADQIEDVVDA